MEIYYSNVGVGQKIDRYYNILLSFFHIKVVVTLPSCGVYMFSKGLSEFALFAAFASHSPKKLPIGMRVCVCFLPGMDL